jgi:hypothetical protein
LERQRRFVARSAWQLDRDLPTLLMRATSGKRLDKSRLFRPSWFYSIKEVAPVCGFH